MRVVRPHRDFGLLPLSLQMLDQSIESLGHMSIPKVPGRDSSVKHRAVVFFGVKHQARILFSEKEFILRHSPITAGVIGRPPPQLHELFNHFAFT